MVGLSFLPYLITQSVGHAPPPPLTPLWESDNLKENATGRRINDNFLFLGKYSVGQNMAGGSFRYGWWSVIKAWYDEVKDFRYGNKAYMAKNPHMTVGHYTQVVWAGSARIGCAWVQCKGQRKVYGCNYGPT
jgi:hypothetical protein